MKAAEIKVGDHYVAKINGNLTVVKVLAIRHDVGGWQQPHRSAYDVTNLVTGRNTSFRSAAKFRRALSPEQATKWIAYEKDLKGS